MKINAGRNVACLEEQISFRLDEEPLDNCKEVKDLGLILTNNLTWSTHLKNRIAKSLKCLFLMKRNTSENASPATKVHLYRAIINPTLLYASECWELRRSEYITIERFNRKALSWIYNNDTYANAMKKSNLLPPLYFKVLKDLLLYSSIINGKYSTDFTEFFNIKEDGRKRVLLPLVRYNIERQNFWYRTGMRINMIQQHIDFFDEPNLKTRLLYLMWNFFDLHWTENNPCTWIFLCLCDNCRANPIL